MENRPTRAIRTQWLYAIPLLLFVLGMVFVALANAQPYVPGGPHNAVDDFFWNGGWILFGISILGVIMSIWHFVWRARAAKTPK